VGAVDLLTLVDEGRSDRTGRTVGQAVTAVEQGGHSQVNGQGDGDNGDNQCKHDETSLFLLFLGFVVACMNINSVPPYCNIDAELVFNRF
jgi:hypothetical protein